MPFAKMTFSSNTREIRMSYGQIVIHGGNLSKPKSLRSKGTHSFDAKHLSARQAGKRA
jgi:hypothetical protein